MTMMEIHEEWRTQAACIDDEQGVFFPADGDVGAINAAKAICAGCPVFDDCLSYALETNQSEGIWGGRTPRERRKLRREWIEEIRRAS